MSGDEIRTKRLEKTLGQRAGEQAVSFLQGASNAAASNLSGPVDMLAWLLRKGGVPVGDAPVGSSQWMANAGFTAQPKNQLSGLLGEGAGLAAPIAAFAKAPQIAGGLLALDDHAMDMGRRAIEKRMVDSGMIQPATVWHGSPHKFDKFDASKIGTTTDDGLMGQGFYFSTDKRVAEKFPNQYLVDVNNKSPLQVSLPNFRTSKKSVVANALGLHESASAKEITEAARKKGFDSIVLDYAPTGYNHKEIVSFSDVPTSIMNRGQ